MVKLGVEERDGTLCIRGCCVVERGMRMFRGRGRWRESKRETDVWVMTEWSPESPRQDSQSRFTALSTQKHLALTLTFLNLTTINQIKTDSQTNQKKHKDN